MLCCRAVNNKINKLHERTCKDRQSTFEKLLDKDKSFNIHHRNLQVLVTEIYIKYILKLPQAL